MKSNFNDCLARVLKDEGGYSNDPADSGGPTNFGITLRDYRLYINPKGTALDVKRMKIDDAKQIYREKYWNALGCDNLASGVDYTCFDYGVNSGLGRPRKALQQFRLKDGVDLIDAINNERTAFLEAIGHGKNAKFEAGWQSRVKRVRNYSKYLAANPPKNNTVGPATGAATIGIGAVISQYWHSHELMITIAAILTVGLIVGIAVHYFKNRK